jgi:2',3'-cyclic-nucleotide 2'-phosphodiesterase (5'-nucleotidase family)
LETKRPPGAPLDILFVSHRASYLEPCGCSLRPLGGIQRQWNALQQVRDPKVPTFSFEGGRTFVPSEFQKKETKHFPKKAKVILEALNAMGVSALTPSGEDFAVGGKELKALAKTAKFPFVAANLLDPKTKQPHFARYTVLEAAGVGKILVTGISLPLEHKWLAKEVKVDDPKTSLQKVFDETKGQTFALVVVLSSLAHRERTALQEAFPQVNVLLGGDGMHAETRPFQDSATSLHADPLEFAKSITRLHFGFAKGWQAPVQPYAEKNAAEADLSESGADNRLYNVKHELTLKVTPAEKAAYLEEQKQLGAFIARMRAVKAVKPGPVQYTHDTVDLDGTWDEPAVNPMQKLHEAYLESVHQAATH